MNGNYLLTILLKDDLEEKDKKELLEGIKKNFVKLEKEDLWGSKDLAYKIKHSDKGYFAHFEFEGDPSKIPSLDKSLKLNEDILRFLLLRRN